MIHLEGGVVETVVLMLLLMLITVACVGLDAHLLGNVVVVYASIQIVADLTVANVETDVLMVSCASMGCVAMLSHCLQGHFHFQNHGLALLPHFLLNRLDHNQNNHRTHHTHLIEV